MQQPHTRYSNAELLSYLKSNYLFEKFSDSILQDVIADMEWVCLENDEILFRQGDAGDFLYLVFRGHLQVTINGKGGAEVPVSEIGPDTILGEIHDIHLWSLDGTSHIFSCHILFREGLPLNRIMDIIAEVKEQLNKIGITHSTLETEISKEGCVRCE